MKLSIGVRDSGVGGLTVARELQKRLPQARLLYFADTAHVPYGDKSSEEIRHYALSISAFLRRQGANAIVFACNTTSAHALDLAREKFAPLPMFGVIEPGARLAVQYGRKIGVLATQATVNSGIYTRVLQRIYPHTQVCEVACPAFVPLVEGEQTLSDAAREACHYYLEPLRRMNADAVILGCTHYPLLLPMLRQVAPELQFIDPATALVEDVAAHYSYLEPVQEPPRFWASGPKEGVENWIRTLLGIPNPCVEVGPVFDLHLPHDHSTRHHIQA